MAVPFRARDREFSQQVKRIKSEYRAAKAVDNTVVLTRLKEEAWRLTTTLVPLVHGDPRMASLVSDLVRICLPLEIEAKDWFRALSACSAMDLAVATILHTLGDRGFLGKRAALLKLLLIETPAVAEAAAYAAHRAGHPVSALSTLESLTGITFELRTSLTVLRHLDRKWTVNPGGQADLHKAAALRQETRTAALQGHTLGNLRLKQEEAILAVLARPERADPVEEYFLTSTNAHAVRAARLTGRTVVYVVPGYDRSQGVAIRVNRDRVERNLVESTALAGLQASAVRSQAEGIRAAFRQYANGSLAPADLDHLLGEFQDYTGAAVWEDILAAWPDLAHQRLAVIPVGRAALLPLYTASVAGAPACTRIDLTIAPSARALHYAAIQPATGAQPRPLVAADHWGGRSYLPYADDEARAIAAVYGTTPILCETDTAAALGGHRSLRILGSFAGMPMPGLTPASADIAARMREATVVHLCCHGVLNDGNIAPALLLGGIMQLTQILQPGGHDESGEERQLRGHPLVVLSACELGGFLEMGMPGEQTGFPAGFMAMGARAVVGSLWLVLDGRPTRRLMEDFHRRLADLPPNAALSATIAQAHLSGVPRLIWGSLSHYGV